MEQLKHTPTPIGLHMIGPDGLTLASGMAAGDLVLLNGLLADPSVYTQNTLLAAPQPLTEAAALWRQAEQLLQSADSATARIVRADQFFSDWRSVPFFHQVRRQHCPVSAPSTSILQAGLLMPAATMAMDLIAFQNDAGTIEPVFPAELDIPATSAFAPVMCVNNWVFVAGFMAAQGKGDLGGIAHEAKVPEGHLWKGNRIQLETDYLIRRKLIPALASVGLTLAHVRKATISLSDLRDLPAMNQVWIEAFGGHPPATTIIPTVNPGFAIADARIEINLIADRTRPAVLHQPPMHRRCAFGPSYPIASRMGDFRLFSGALAVQEDNRVSGATGSTQRGHQSSPIDEQMAWLIDTFAEFCDLHGAKLANVVKITHLHTDLRDFAPSCRAWQRRLPGMALPISGMKVNRLPHDEACVQVETWVYAPDTSSHTKTGVDNENTA
jgi:enamine deaminase RidA (YjgF/YER057c/UK114 family)